MTAKSSEATMQRVTRYTVGFALIWMGTFASVAGATPTRVLTGDASQVAVNSATISGSISGDAGATYWLEYGPSTSYGSTTQHIFLVDRAATATASISGLKSGTTYHFRMVAFDAAGLHTGRDAVFTTLPAFLPRAITLEAKILSPRWVRADAGIAPGATVTSYAVEFGRTTDYDETSAAAAVPGDAVPGAMFSVEVGPLEPDTTYHYRAVARNEKGVSRGRDRTFHTPPLPPRPEAQTLDATHVQEDLATLEGRVYPHGKATRYVFDYGTTTDYGSRTLPATVAAGTPIMHVTAPVQGLTPDTLYHFRLVTTNANGSARGRDLRFRTPPLTPGSPDIDSADISATAGSVIARIGIRTHGSSFTEVVLQVGTTTTYGSTTSHYHGGPAGTVRTHDVLTVPGLTPATRYHVRIFAQNQFGTTRGPDRFVTTAGSAEIAILAAGVYGASATPGLRSKRVHLAFRTAPIASATAGFFQKVKGSVQPAGFGQTTCLYPPYIQRVAPPAPCDYFDDLGHKTYDMPASAVTLDDPYPQNDVYWPDPGVVLPSGRYRVVLSALFAGKPIGAPVTLDFSVR